MNKRRKHAWLLVPLSAIVVALPSSARATTVGAFNGQPVDPQTLLPTGAGDPDMIFSNWNCFNEDLGGVVLVQPGSLEGTIEACTQAVWEVPIRLDTVQNFLSPTTFAPVVTGSVGMTCTWQIRDLDSTVAWTSASSTTTETVNGVATIPLQSHALPFGSEAHAYVTCQLANYGQGISTVSW